MAVTLPPPSFTLNLITSILFSTTSPSLKPKCEIICLQQIQNYLACTVVKAPKSCHITPILHSHTPFTRYNRLSTGLTTCVTSMLNKEPLFVQPVVKPGCTTGLTTGWMFVYTIQPVVKAVWQPVWQPVILRIQTFNWLSNLTLSYPICTIQPVIKPVWQPVWQTCWTNSHCSFNRLSNRVVQPVWQPAVYTIQPAVKPVVKRVVNRLNVCIHDTTGCQGGLTTSLTTGYIVYTNI